MSTIRIVGHDASFLPIAHMKYLKEHLGIRLKVAMAITNDTLAGKVQEISVDPGQALRHAAGLRAVGAVVEVIGVVQVAEQRAA